MVAGNSLRLLSLFLSVVTIRGTTGGSISVLSSDGPDTYYESRSSHPWIPRRTSRLQRFRVPGGASRSLPGRERLEGHGLLPATRPRRYLRRRLARGAP